MSVFFDPLLGKLSFDPPSAPTNATYITQTPNSVLTGEQALSLLATGYMKSTTTTGVVTTQATPIPVTDGGTGTNTAFTPGSVIFAGTSGVYSQNNSKFFWSDTVGKLSVGTNTSVSFSRVLFDGASSSIEPLAMMNSNAAGFAFLHMLTQAGADAAGFGYANSGAAVYAGKSYFYTVAKDFFVSTDNTVTQHFFIKASTGLIGIGTNAPSALLHIKAGTASAASAPLKFTSGTLNTTAEAGAVEFLTDKYYGTITTAAARKEFALNETALLNGPVLFGNSNGRLAQDANFFWNNTSKYLGINTNDPKYYLQVRALGETGAFYGMGMSPALASDGANYNLLFGNGAAGFRFYGTSIGSPYGTAQITLGADQTITFNTGSGAIFPTVRAIISSVGAVFGAPAFAGTTGLYYVSATNSLGVNTGAPQFMVHVKALSEAATYAGIRMSPIISTDATNYNVIGSIGGKGFAMSGTSASSSYPNAQISLDAAQTILFLNGSGAGTPTEKMRLASTGFLGIGDTDPLALLSVGAGSLTDSNLKIQMSTAGAGTVAFLGVNKNGSYGTIFGYYNAFGGYTGGIIRTITADPFQIWVNNTTVAVNIPSTGLVGINAVTPLAQLSVGAGSLTDSNVTIQSSTAGAGTQNYLGINKNGSYGLLVGFLNSVAGYTGSVIRTVTADPFQIWVNNTTVAMQALSTGRIQIGTTTDTAYAKVKIDSASASIEPLAMMNSNAAGYAFLHMLDQSAADAAGFGYANSGAAAGLASKCYFYTVAKDFFVSTDNTTTQHLTVLATNGRVGIKTAAPTAMLHLPAGTASASTAPLKFTSGTLQTTAEAGAVEFLTDAFYGTITTGAARKQFAFTSGGGLMWTEVTGTSQSAAVNSGYIANNAGLVTVTIPTTAAIGDIVAVEGKGAGLFVLAQSAGQSIRFGTLTTTVGAGGSLTATDAGDGIEIVCITANVAFKVRSSTGTFTLV